MAVMHWLEANGLYVAIAVSLTIGLCALVHILMTKNDVRAAVGWSGLVMLSPLIGALLYAVLGVNRIRIRRVSRQRENIHPDDHRYLSPCEVDVARDFGDALANQKLLGDAVSEFPLHGGNSVEMLAGGDQAYAAMLEAIAGARRHIALQSYIFDNDAVGREFVQALAEACSRGVEVRVLVDAVGEKYSRPPIGKPLRRAGVPYARFMPGAIGLRLAYANLRSHSKLLVVDGAVGFTGGLNIRQAFASRHAGAAVARDTHFRLEGPVVLQLMYRFAHDWAFTTGESLYRPEWFPRAPMPGRTLARCVPSGPDQSLGSNHGMILGALAFARDRVLIQTPYFLPDVALVAALATTVRRGVRVDIVIPGANNLRLIDYAMSAQLDQVVAPGCRVWRSSGGFDHSKLMTVDGLWAYVGSSNLDQRSLRLNFELDIELYDRDLARRIESYIRGNIAGGTRQTLAGLAAKPFARRLRNRLVWLASPYL